MKKIIGLLVFLFYGSLVIAGPLKKVTLQLKWSHQFQFAGYYAALEKGYYKDAGLDVTIKPLTPGENPVNIVLAGKADYGVSGSGLALRRLKGDPVVALAVVLQHSPMALAVLNSSGINYPEDLKGKTLMVPEFETEIFAYLKKSLFSFDSLTIIKHSANIHDLLDGKTDAITIYSTEEPFELREHNADYKIFTPRTIGLDFYGDCIFTSEAKIKNSQNEAEAFRDASLKGWKYALENPEEIIALIMKKYTKRRSYEHLKFEFASISELINKDEIALGSMNPEKWKFIVSIYQDLGMCDKSADLQNFFIEDFNANNVLGNRQNIYMILALIFSIILIIIISGMLIRISKLNRKLSVENIEKGETEEKLRVSEQKHRFLIENMNDVLWEVNQKFIITFISPSVFKWLGYKQEELLNKVFVEYLTQDSRQVIIELIRESKENELQNIKRVARELEMYIFDSKGAVVCAEVSITPIYSSSNQFVGYHGLTRDITKRKTLENAMKRNEAFLNEIINNAPDNIFAIEIGDSDEYKIVITNEGMCRLLNKDKSEIINNRLENVVGETYLSRIKNNYLEIKNSQNPQSFEEEYIIRDRRFIFETNLSKVSILGTNYIIGISRDITSRKQMEKELFENEQAFKRIIEYMPFPLVVTRVSDKTVFMANTKSYDLFGEPYEIGSELNVEKYYFNPEDRVEFLRKVRNNSYVKDSETQFINARGEEFWAVFSSVLVSMNNEYLIISGLNDITSRKKSEEALIAANKELERANQVKSEFLSHISHEIRTPLNAILGFAELIKYKIADPDLKDYLKGIESGGSSLLHLLNDILDLSKIESGIVEIKKNPMDIIALAGDIKSIFSYEAQKKGLSLKLEIHPGLPNKLILDEARLRQTLLNLVGNAVKFTAVGEVRLAIDYISTNSGSIDLIIKIVDSGVGILAGEQEQIFEAFYQTKVSTLNANPGAGLGLAITKRLVEMMGGSIFLESYPDKGSTFVVELFDVVVHDCQNELQTESSGYRPIKCLALVEDLQNVPYIDKLFKEYEIQSKFIRIENKLLDELEQFSPDFILIHQSSIHGDDFQLIANSLTEINIPKLLFYFDLPEGGIDLFDVAFAFPIDIGKFTAIVNKILMKKSGESSNYDEMNANKNINYALPPVLVFKEFRVKFENRIQNLISGFSIDEVTALAQDLLSFGKEANYDKITDFANNLIATTSSFDFYTIKEQLNKLKDIIESYSDNYDVD